MALSLIAVISDKGSPRPSVSVPMGVGGCLMALLGIGLAPPGVIRGCLPVIAKVLAVEVSAFIAG